ncbi:hypothetical protein ACH5RR_000891 [Cinchona calisaya]|uniref:RNase H type-1 domain-containing protein n=1 Tax=Cinchona calisaya TaxID=153742 RepID=A0ABD3B1X2_9GENT
MVCWSSSTQGKIKLNVDGSFISSIGLARGGGLIHSSSSSLLAGFACFFKHKTIMKDELLALIKGLQVSMDKNFFEVTIESDSQVFCHMILGCKSYSWKLDALICHAKYHISKGLLSFIMFIEKLTV